MIYICIYFAIIYSIFWSGRPPRTPPKISVISEKPTFFGPFLEQPHFTSYFGRFTPSRRHFRIPHEISVLPSYLEVWKSKFKHSRDKTPLVSS